MFLFTDPHVLLSKHQSTSVRCETIIFSTPSVHTSNSIQHKHRPLPVADRTAASPSLPLCLVSIVTFAWANRRTTASWGWNSPNRSHRLCPSVETCRRQTPTCCSRTTASSTSTTSQVRSQLQRKWDVSKITFYVLCFLWAWEPQYDNWLTLINTTTDTADVHHPALQYILSTLL